MSARTRYFVIGAGLVLTVGLGTGLVAYYSGVLPHLGSHRGPEELSYVPADSSVVAYANVREIMNSEFRQKMRQVLPSGTERDQFQNEWGIDIEHDIDYVVAALHGGGPGNSGTLVIIHTSANPVAIEDLARRHGATVADYHGKRMLLLQSDEPKAPETPPASGVTITASTPPTTGSIAFLETSVIAVGDEMALKRAIDAHTGANITSNAEMMTFIGDLDGQVQNAWAVGRFDDASKSVSLPGAVSAQLAAVQWFSLTGHVDGGVSGKLRLDARDDGSAENLRDIVRGGLALARLQMGHDTKLDTVINSLQLQGTGKTVELSFSAPPEILDVINGVAGLANMGRQMQPTIKK
jgi:hypothetical protein